MKTFVPLIATAQAATLAVTWSDCGDSSTHAKVTDLQPTSIQTGTTTTLVGKGDLDETVNGATFTQVIKADGVQVASCSGDASQDVQCKLPLGVGSITLKAQTFPLAAGTASIPVDVKVSSLIPASLAKTNSHIEAVSDTGDKLFCMDVQTSKAEEQVAAQGGALALTWSDCGGAHGTTSSVEPSVIQLGQSTDIVGKGSTDKAITAGTYDMHMTAGGGLINKHFTGNNCEAKDFSLPLGLGTLSWAGIECPLAVGATELHFTTKLASALPAKLATSDITMQAMDQDGESALCVNIHMAKQEVSVPQGGALALTWSDCGGAHGTTESVEPSVIQLGQSTDIVGKGSTDKAITSGTYDMHMTAGGGLINKHFTGNNCEAKDFSLPLGLGTLSWAGIECPLAVGATELHFTTKLASALPAKLATSDITMQAMDQDGESALCVNIHMAKQDLLV